MSLWADATAKADAVQRVPADRETCGENHTPREAADIAKLPTLLLFPSSSSPKSAAVALAAEDVTLVGTHLPATINSDPTAKVSNPFVIPCLRPPVGSLALFSAAVPCACTNAHTLAGPTLGWCRDKAGHVLYVR
ncbi:hypothetical protein E2562_016596 [Oryza meyeriana var. granulata]|uniref:Uncharacterized protein n=1 Tax=Oryza meyeriana var. granulata TaxID=110450 RepID=A0A6G1C6S6_9ORYZ|nr:hypothetical protein E2562_016596 [Oryza meyeriana var. granulata]